MKKTFVEPDMKVILVNLNENIATSGGGQTSVGGSLILNTNSDGKVIDTGATQSEMNSYLWPGKSSRSTESPGDFGLLNSLQEKWPTVRQCYPY